jgi:hypothetical protein
MYNMFEDKLQNDPLINMIKSLHHDTSETEVNRNLSANSGSKKF